jgi:hypothetical protein
MQGYMFAAKLIVIAIESNAAELVLTAEAVVESPQENL